MSPGGDLLVLVLGKSRRSAIIRKEVFGGSTVLLRTVVIRAIWVVLIIRVRICEGVVAVTGCFGTAVRTDRGTFCVVTFFQVVRRSLRVCFVLDIERLCCILYRKTIIKHFIQRANADTIL